MAPKTIMLKGKGIRNERPAAAAGILPGHLLEIDSAGDYAVHSTATDNVGAKTFAIENELFGGDISTAYAAGDQVLAEVPPPGSVVYAWLLDGEVAVIGSRLDSNGDGTLKLVDTDAATDDTQRNAIVGIATEALSPSGANGRIKVEIV